jgi:hypothetical protein
VIGAPGGTDERGSERETTTYAGHLSRLGQCVPSERSRQRPLTAFALVYRTSTRFKAPKEKKRPTRMGRPSPRGLGRKNLSPATEADKSVRQTISTRQCWKSDLRFRAPLVGRDPRAWRARRLESRARGAIPHPFFTPNKSGSSRSLPGYWPDGNGHTNAMSSLPSRTKNNRVSVGPPSVDSRASRNAACRKLSSAAPTA